VIGRMVNGCLLVFPSILIASMEIVHLKAVPGVLVDAIFMGPLLVSHLLLGYTRRTDRVAVLPATWRGN
jgi:hypothetical protein